MYDECGRTTPLGPNEYVLVSFNTVETEDGKEKLEHYNLHLFTDGTIIFIEDGVPNPAGRAKEIEGQRGAVGFGPSPNCPFDHVVAEFQIELEAAGGHSYSPDPLFWSSSTPPEICGDGIDNNGNGQIDEGCPPPPGIKIIGTSIVRSTGPFVGPIEMGQSYKLNVAVVENNPSRNPTLGIVNVDETILTDPATTSLGDTSPDAHRLDAANLTLGVPHNFSFPDPGRGLK